MDLDLREAPLSADCLCVADASPREKGQAEETQSMMDQL